MGVDRRVTMQDNNSHPTNMYSDEASLSKPLQDDTSMHERVQPSEEELDPSINAADVLCGRGKTSYHHRKFLP